MQKARRLRTGPHLLFRWWRREDLNLRPSGYEPAQCRTFWSRLLPCSTADEAIRATFVTSSPVPSRRVRQTTAPSTAPRAMQNDRARSVPDVSGHEVDGDASAYLFASRSLDTRHRSQSSRCGSLRASRTSGQVGALYRVRVRRLPFWSLRRRRFTQVQAAFPGQRELVLVHI